ncbi:NADP-dependent oxidoreductase domain-containing protein [Podospora aff. communis PSN243]|uniref:NADP-dependent oxidoreductase domain-containing protein n=1 Tax=Podospora aff. communis PSN243 TaxID=3040156 RepID=A0AAV9G928_9PEZI|nr:NADP-dependent oxidoreductase domain-containing protein [Podospora aff. communis PSN243]
MPGANPLPFAPPAQGPLARYRVLSPTASIRVSPLCLGAMGLGDAWSDYMGPCSPETTEEILDYFYSQGGNFIDTSSNYQFEDSERRLGAWMKKRGNRDQMVIATKYTANFLAVEPDMTPKANIMINYTGNGTKSLNLSVKASLEKLQTKYIDILYVHFWDFSTSIPELMQSLNRLISAGQVLHLGISDTPAWVVSKANEYARNHNLRPFSVYQGRWSAAARDFEREILPMCRAEGMAVAPWGALGAGKFKSAAQRGEKGEGEGRVTRAEERDVRVSEVLERIASKKGTVVTGVAQAYVCAKAAYVFPVVGCRTLEHLKGNIEALKVKLSGEEIKEIEAAVPFELGFPGDFFWGKEVPEVDGDVWLLAMGGTIDHVPGVKPLGRE